MVVSQQFGNKGKTIPPLSLNPQILKNDVLFLPHPNKMASELCGEFQIFHECKVKKDHTIQTYVELYMLGFATVQI